MNIKINYFIIIYVNLLWIEINILIHFDKIIFDILMKEDLVVYKVIKII